MHPSSYADAYRTAPAHPGPEGGEAHPAAPEPAASRYVLDKLGQGLCVFDGAQRLVLSNRRYAEMYDLAPGELRPGMTLREVIALRVAAGTGPEMPPGDYAAWRDRVAVEDSVVDTLVHLRNGRTYAIHHEPTPDGGWVATHEDVTARLRAEEALRETNARFDAALAHMSQGLCMYDAAGRLAVVNRRYCEIFGLPPEEVRLGSTRREAVQIRATYGNHGGASADEIYERSGGALARRQPGTWTAEAVGGRDVEVKYQPLADGGWVATFDDVTERLGAERALRQKTALLDFTLGAMDQGLVMVDAEGRVRLCNPRAVQLLGLPDELVARGPLLSEVIEHQARAGEFAAQAEDRPGWLTGDLAAVPAYYERTRPNGTVLEVRTVHLPGGGIVRTYTDVTDRKRAEAQAFHMARHDPLTDLPNRVLFRERLDQRLAELRRRRGGSGGSCAVLLLDLDRFKAVNDMRGQRAGDLLLQKVAQRLRDALRAEDLVARLGADEFAVLLGEGEGDADGPAGVAGVAERLIAAVGAPMVLGGSGQPVEMGLSIGIAVAPADGTGGEALHRRAGLALQRAKAEGRGTYRSFEPAMDEAASERLRLERDLRCAVAAGGLALHYQPQVRGATGDLVGFEALVRWHHGERGSVPPAAFVPIAEETGLIDQLGEWVLRTACREAAGWAHPVKVAVNLSPRQFERTDLPDRVGAILAETGLPPERLELEITETVMIDDLARALGILRRLKAMGIRIAMDDFGTGHSSLATLHAFPFDAIKIDRQFVGQVERSPQAAAIVRAVLGLGRSLGVGVVAEGVETGDQMRFLAAERCDEVQGYLFGRPQAVADFSRAASWSGKGAEVAPGAGALSSLASQASPRRRRRATA